MSALKNISRFVLAMMVLVGLVGFSASPAFAAQTCAQYHTVQRGETLYRIGLQYNVSWRTLADINDLANPNRIYAGQRLCVELEDDDDSTPPPAPSKIPTFSIVSVAKDSTVTIETANFPANDSFVVTMGEFGTRGVNGVRVATTNSGNGGKFTATYNIPAELKGESRIAIRLQSPTSGYFSYNWFYNNTAGSGTGGVGDPGDDDDDDNGYTGFPTFSIASVAQDSTVTISGRNFPANTSFNVLMGRFGTAGVNGIRVTTIDTGAGGEFTATYNIPAELKGLSRIAIRLESPSTGYFAFNWFWNN